MSNRLDWVFWVQETPEARKSAKFCRIGITKPERTKEAKIVRQMLDSDEVYTCGFCTVSSWLNMLFTENNGVL